MPKKRDLELFIVDVLVSIEKIKNYTKTFNLSIAIEQELPKQMNPEIVKYLNKLKKVN